MFKRQKYHESRLNAALPNSNFNTFTEESQKKSTIIKEFIPCFSPSYVTDFLPTVYNHSKTALPPIKNVNMVLDNQSNAPQNSSYLAINKEKKMGFGHTHWMP
ncbi:UNVERIFIED_CONTAM: hypothetical protein NCL1_39158 [Trichonephila clavipes]